MPSRFSSRAQTVDQIVAGILKHQYKMDSMHNLREGSVDVQEFLNSLALKDGLFNIACSWVNVKPADVVCSWQELLPGLKVPHLEDVMDDVEVGDSSSSLVLCEATKNSVKEDEYEEAWMWKTNEDEALRETEIDDPALQ
jgi:hypothetical protein